MPMVGAAITAISTAFTAASTGFTAWATTALTSIGVGQTVASSIASVALKSFTQIALGLALGAISRALLPKPKPQISGTRVTMQTGEEGPYSFPMGITCTPGELLYAGSWDGEEDTPNENFVQVIELSDRPANLRRCYINGEFVILKPNEIYLGRAVEGYEKDGADRLFVKFYDGTQTTADSYLLDKFGNHPTRPWTSDMMGLGMCYVVVTAGIRKDVNRQRPECKFEIESKGWYDPRKDSSVGGLGAQRYNNWKTWTPSENPVVHAYNIMRGIRDPITDEFVWGGQSNTSKNLTPSSWFAAMNACDNRVNTTKGLEPEYRSGMEVFVSDEPAGVIEELMKSCNGVIAEVSGEWDVRAGGPGPSVYSFTDNDVIYTSPDKFTPIKALDEAYNGVSATYIEPANGWLPKDAPIRINQAYLADDLGKKNIAELKYPFVPYLSQVQRLMKTALEDERRMRVHTMEMPPDFQVIGPLDDVTYTSVRNGYINKLFSVEMVEDFSNNNVALAIRERDPSDYDFGISDELPSSVGYTPTDPRPPRYADFSVQPWTITDSATKARAPAIRLNWTVKSGVTGIRYLVRLADTQELVQTDGRSSKRTETVSNPFLIANNQPVTANSTGITFYTIDTVNDGYAIISGRSILPNEDYEVNAMYEPTQGQDWLPEWLLVTTPNIRLQEEDLETTIINKINDAATQADTAGQQARDAYEKAVSVENIVGNLSGDLLDQVQDITDQLEGISTGDIQEIRGIAMAGLRKGGWLADPSFSEWSSAATPVLLKYTQSNIAYSSKLINAAGAPFPTSIYYNVPAGNTGSTINLIAYSYVSGQMLGADPKAEYVTAELMMRLLSGDFTDMRVRVEWRATGTTTWTIGHAFGTTSTLGRVTTDWGLAVDPNRTQSRVVVWKRPIANADAIRIHVAVKVSTGIRATEFRIDYLNLNYATETDIKATLANEYADAQINEFSATIIGPTGAIASMGTTIRAEFAAADAVVKNSVVALASDVETLAADITTVEAQYGGSNIVKNPQFSDGPKSPGQIPRHWSDWDAEMSVVQKTEPGVGPAAQQTCPTKFMAMTPNDTVNRYLRANQPYPIRAGEKIEMRGQFAAGGVTPQASVRMWVRFYTAEGGVAADVFGSILDLSGSTWREYTSSLEPVAPANAATYSQYIQRITGTVSALVFFTNISSRVIDQTSLATATSALASASNANQAVATINQQASAQFGSFNAMVSQTATAVATANMAASTYVVRFLNGSFRLVGWNDNTGSGSAILLDADNVIAPGTLSTGALVITDLGYNLVPDDQLQASSAWLRNDTGWQIIPTTTGTNVDSIGEARWVRANSTSAPDFVARYHGQWFPVKPGKRYLASFQIASVGSGAFRGYGELQFADKEGGNLGVEAIQGAVSGTTQTLISRKEQFVAPTSSVKARVIFRVDKAATVVSAVRFWAPRVILNEDASVLITPDAAFFEQLSAKVAWIYEANIVNLNVTRIKVAEGSISNTSVGFRSSNLTVPDNVWTTIVSTTITKSANEAVFINFRGPVIQPSEFRWTIQDPGGIGVTFVNRNGSADWRILRNSTVIENDIGNSGWIADVSSVSGTSTYALQVMNTVGSSPSGAIGNTKLASLVIGSRSVIGVQQVVK